MIRRHSLRALQLIKISISDNQFPRPVNSLLVLHVELRHLDGFRCVDFILGQEFGRREFKDVEAALDLRPVDVAVVPVGGPVAAQHQHFWINWPTIEIGDLDRIGRVGKVHDRDAALVPSLNHDIAARNGNDRAIMSDAVFRVALRGRHFVIARKLKLSAFQMEDRISSPHVRISCAAASTQAAAPFVCENDLFAVIRK